MFTPSLMLLSKFSSTTLLGPDLNRSKQREQRFSFPSPLPLFAPVEFLPRVFISLLLEELRSDGFAAAMGSAVAMCAAATLAVGLTKMRCAEAEKISQPTTKVFVFQRKQFFTGSQAAIRFHGTMVLHFSGGFKAGVDEFAQARVGSEPS